MWTSCPAVAPESEVRDELAFAAGIPKRPWSLPSEAVGRATSVTLTLGRMATVEWAEMTARRLLEVPLPRRWAHVEAVAARAGRMAGPLGSDGELLRVAAWVHDVGYSPELISTAFHPLDGAKYLRSIKAEERLAGLVAFHSSAASEAEALGLDDQLAEFTDERTLVRDLLWYADMTIGPSGEILTFEERMNEVRERYSPDHYVIRALDAGMGERRDAVLRAERWIDEVGLTDQV